jgi:hypothetical protein
MNQPTYQELYQAKQQAEYDAHNNAMTAAQNEAEAAWQYVQNARMTGDHGAEEQAMARHARANAQIAMLESGANQPDEQQQQLQQRPQYTAQQILSAMPNISGRERSWLTEHPELVTTQEGQLRLQAAWYESQQKGIERDSDEYFNFFNDRFGFAPAESLTAPQQQYVVGGPNVQAKYNPPTKPYVPNTPTVKMSDEEAAKISGVDLATYRANKQKLREFKQQGFYQDR